ncbi:GL18211 [Drosophila persimilis]|uniref:GL18211 n=1 Tax=Drosophila persimilis TaxID=7234 RepID=B4H4L6_DROPE|nr:GL18211 [Drosophila persimilis]
MAWDMRSVYLRLKKRHPEDKDAHTLQAGEVEKDLGLESIVEAAQGLALEDEEEEDDDLTLVVNPSGATLYYGIDFWRYFALRALEAWALEAWALEAWALEETETEELEKVKGCRMER